MDKDTYVVGRLSEVLRGYGCYHYNDRAPAIATALAFGWSVSRVRGGLFCELIATEPTHGQVVT